MLLPIGSVVRVGGQKIVITGYRPILMEKGGALIYLGFAYPYGYLCREKTVLIPERAIQEVLSMGYTGQEEEDGDIPEDRKKGLLPVGSVVALEQSETYLYMIAGYYPSNENAAGEYSVVPYPNGIIDPNEVGMIAERQIRKVLGYGYLDKEGEEILRKIPDFMEDTSRMMKDFADTMQHVLHSTRKDKGEEDELSVVME